MSSPIQPYPFSYLVNLFPRMTPAEFAALVASIREHGLRDPIWVWCGEIIDGQNHFLACIEAGVEPRYEHLPDHIDPLDYVLDKNLNRRNMSAGQRAVSAHKLLSQSGPARPRREDGDSLARSYTQQEAAKRFRVSRSELNLVIEVMSEDSGAHPEVRLGIEQGLITPNDAMGVMREPPEIQLEAMARVTRGEHTTVVRAVRRVKEETARREDAAALEAALARQVPEGVILHHSAVADLHTLVAPETVDAIITHPPAADERSPALLSDLAGFASYALRPGGVMAVLASASALPQFLDGLRHPELQWVLESDLQFSRALGRSGQPYFVNLRRRPMLVYGKLGFTLNGGDDVIAVPAPGDLPEGQKRWHPVEVGMAMTVRRFPRPGQAVCDPCLMGRIGTALGARKAGCSFIGADSDEGRVEMTRGLLSGADGAASA